MVSTLKMCNFNEFEFITKVCEFKYPSVKIWMRWLEILWTIVSKAKYVQADEWVTPPKLKSFNKSSVEELTTMYL